MPMARNTKEVICTDVCYTWRTHLPRHMRMGVNLLASISDCPAYVYFRGHKNMSLDPSEFHLSLRPSNSTSKLKLRWPCAWAPMSAQESISDYPAYVYGRVHIPLLISSAPPLILDKCPQILFGTWWQSLKEISRDIFWSMKSELAFGPL